MKKNSLHSFSLSVCLSLLTHKHLNTENECSIRATYIVMWSDRGLVKFISCLNEVISCISSHLRGLKINVTYYMIKHLTEEKHNVHTHPQT